MIGADGRLLSITNFTRIYNLLSVCAITELHLFLNCVVRFDVILCFDFWLNCWKIRMFENTRTSSTSSKLRYVSHILMRGYALTLTVYKFLDIGIVVGSCVEIAIDDNQDNCIICFMLCEKYHWETCRYWAINTINCPIIIADLKSKCRIC